MLRQKIAENYKRRELSSENLSRLATFANQREENGVKRKLVQQNEYVFPKVSSYGNRQVLIAVSSISRSCDNKCTTSLDLIFKPHAQQNSHKSN